MKSLLLQYGNLKKEHAELCARIEKLEAKIEKIVRDGTVKDKVKGGYGGKQSFQIEGFPESEYSRAKHALQVRKSKLMTVEAKMDALLTDVEQKIYTIDDSYIRRIISLRVVDGLKWEQVAAKMGGGNSGDSVRKIFVRYIENL